MNILEKIFFFLRRTEEIEVHVAIADGLRNGMEYKYYSESPDKDRAFNNLAMLINEDKSFEIKRTYGWPCVQTFRRWIWQ